MSMGRRPTSWDRSEGAEKLRRIDTAAAISFVPTFNACIGVRFIAAENHLPTWRTSTQLRRRALVPHLGANNSVPAMVALPVFALAESVSSLHGLVGWCGVSTIC